MQRKFGNVAVGGTFDEFHKGHEAMLLKAFEIGERVIIGLCSDEFVKKLGKPHSTDSYEDRLREVEKFLQKHDLLGKAEIVALDDVYGITLSKGCIEALIVSEETEPIAHKINEKRMKLRLPPLHITTIGMVPSENHVPISTTRIRHGDIDREGRILKKEKLGKKQQIA